MIHKDSVTTVEMLRRMLDKFAPNDIVVVDVNTSVDMNDCPVTGVFKLRERVGECVLEAWDEDITYDPEYEDDTWID